MYSEFYFWFENRPIKCIINEQGCWLCIGRSKDKGGYVWFWLRGKMMRLHRAMYIKFHGELADHEHVRHTCDNPACCNPAHLLPGSAQNNSDDKKAHCRQICGEQIPSAKLTEEKVRSILKSNISVKELAIENDVTESTIRRILNGTHWKSVKRPGNTILKKPWNRRTANKPSVKNPKYNTHKSKEINK